MKTVQQMRIEELIRFGAEFHAHLDVCRECEEHPFNLCAMGHRLLNLAGGHDAVNFPEIVLRVPLRRFMDE